MLYEVDRFYPEIQNIISQANKTNNAELEFRIR
jgi:hypothetical protein